MSYDEELEVIKQRKLMELRRRLEEEEKKRQIRLQKEMLLRTILTPKARERLANLRLVRPELAEAIEDQLIALAQSRRISVPITDDTLKEILASIYEQTHRETRIRIKEK